MSGIVIFYFATLNSVFCRIFNDILPPERYRHFQCLAFATHLIEASKNDQSTNLEVSDLLEEFDKRFESLYTVSLPFLCFLFCKFTENFFLCHSGQKMHSNSPDCSRSDKQNLLFMHFVISLKVFKIMVRVIIILPLNLKQLLVSFINFLTEQNEVRENENQILNKTTSKIPNSLSFTFLYTLLDYFFKSNISLYIG